MLSALSPDEPRFAVMSSDVKAICQAPGIGKKTAEKLILNSETSCAWRMHWSIWLSKMRCRRLPGRSTKRCRPGSGSAGIRKHGGPQGCKAGGHENMEEEVLKQALKLMMF